MAIDPLVLTGLSVGTKITAANTANYFDINYPVAADRLTVAAVTGGGLGVRTSPAGANAAAKSLSTGRQATGRIGWKMEFTSNSAATSYNELVALRFNTTTGFLVDIGLRHNTATLKRYVAARNNFAYIGQANAGNAYDLDPGEKWSYELYWNGLAATAYVWIGDNTTGTPDFTWTGTMAQAPLNFLFANDSTDGVDAILYDVWVSDGERPPGPPIPGTLTFLSNIWGSQSSLRVSGKVADATNVTFAVGGNTTTVTPDAAGYFKATLTGLAAGTSHSWEVLVDGASRRTGSSRTLPSTLDGHRILWGSCFDTYTSGFFTNAAARNPDLIAMLGDWSYPYLNGVIASTDLATVRAVKETVLAAAGPQGLFSKFITSYTYSDTDGAGANSDGTWQGFTSGAVQGAYRQQWAHPDLPLTDTGARSWVIDKVRFIQTDELTMASDRSATDNSSKSKLGAAQKAWFKAQIDAAKDAHQSVVWFGDGPWLGAASTSGTNNQWTAYSTERTELGAYIAASGIKLVRLHGDTHTLFCDNGTNNEWGGFPTASAAPFHTTANPYTGTVTGGKWPTVQTNSSRQYGIAEFAESAGVLTLNLRGYSSTNSEPTEVERFNMTVDMTPTVAPTTATLQEWDGTEWTLLTPIEWDGTTENVLTIETVS